MAPQKDTDDVLDFINSLPDSKSGTPKPTTASSKDDKQENKEEFLDFLDELAAHEKAKPATPKQKSKASFEPKKVDSTKTSPEALKSVDELEQEDGAAVDAAAAAAGTSGEGADNEIDPIGSISNWWSKEGSTKVSSFWGSIASNAQQISDQTYQLASNTSNQLSQQRQKILKENKFNPEQITQLDYLGDKLNSVLSTMSQQITQGLIGPDDELLNILLIHDLDNVNYLDKECSNKFNKVMNQVEGGIRITVNNFNHKQGEISDDVENLNLFYGKIIDGEKLCFANLESCIKDYSTYNLVEIKKEVEDVEGKEGAETEDGAEQDTSVTSAESSINKSNIFISIQAITSKTNTEEKVESEGDGPILIESNNHDSFSFTLILKDITNNITIITKTQPFPLVWAQWLNGEGKVADENINPSEWVKDWIKDGLSLSFGVLAQQYVIKRMGY